MAKKTEIKKTYYKLGKKAHMFYDPTSELKVANGQVAVLDGAVTPKITRAVNHGHLIQVEEGDYKSYKAGNEVEEEEDETGAFEYPEFGDMTKSDIIEWAEGNCKIPEDEEDLASLSKKELIKRVKELELED